MSYTRSVLFCGAFVSTLFTYLFSDTIFQDLSPGINVPLFFIPFATILAVLTIRNRLPDRRFALWFLGAAAVLSIFVALRDSFFLKGLNLSVITFLFCAASLASQGLKARAAGIVDYLMTIACFLESVTVKSCHFFLEKLAVEDILDEGLRKTLLGIGRGFAIATPLVGIFLALFMSADAAFSELVKKSIYLDLNSLGTHLSVGTLALWFGVGFMHAMFSGSYEREEEIRAEGRYNLGLTEVATVLSLINLLFFSFIVVQFQYFFGGSTNIILDKGLTFAEYARRGFFELVTVAALTLPALLFFDWTLQKTSRLRVLVLRSLSVANIGMLFVIMASAFKRMQLYQAEYGQTELRFYVTAFMLWLGVVFIIFALTVLRGHRSSFALGAVLSGFLAVVGLNLVNPDATIARTNLKRTSLDLSYATTLSADAVPVTLKRLSSLKPEERRLILNELVKKYCRSSKQTSWKNWSLARMQAKNSLNRLSTYKEKGFPLAGPKRSQEPKLPVTRRIAGTGSRQDPGRIR